MIAFTITANSQNYKYIDYLNDNKLAIILRKNISENQIDSLKNNFSHYKNRLGFLYYEVKALTDTNHNNQLRYADSSFMRGLTPLCLPKYFVKKDSIYLQKSFSVNYLKSYNLRLVNIIDSINYRDQNYRQLIMREQENQKVINNNSNNTRKNQSETTNKNIGISSIKLIEEWKILQKKTDSTNFIKFNQVIKEFGWPSASKIGVYYCQRPAPDPSLIIMNLDESKYSYKKDILKHIIELCERQEESWQVAEAIMRGIHSGLTSNYQEFPFLKVINGEINVEESFLSIYALSSILIHHPENKIVIKCKQNETFLDLKKNMLLVNDMKYFSKQLLKDLERDNFPNPKKLDDNSFLFEESSELNENEIMIKIIKK